MKAFDTVRLALALVLFISPETSSLSCTAGQGYLSDETLNKRLGGTPIDLNTYTTVVDMPQCRLLCGGHVGNCKSFIYNSQSQVCIIYAVDKTDYPLVDDAGFSYYDNLRCGFVTTTTTPTTPTTPTTTTTSATPLTTTRPSSITPRPTTPGPSASIPPSTATLHPQQTFITTTTTPGVTATPGVTTTGVCPCDVWEIVEDVKVPDSVEPFSQIFLSLLGQCMTSCRNQAPCAAFTFSVGTKECRMYRQRREDIGPLTPVLRRGIAFYQWNVRDYSATSMCMLGDRFLWQVSLEKELSIAPSDKEELVGNTMEECELACRTRPGCHSFDFASNDPSRCVLNNAIGSDSSLVNEPLFNNYKKYCRKAKTTCQTGEALVWYGRSESQIEQHDDFFYEGVVDHAACEALCLLSPRFVCRSVEYEAVSKLCILSRFSSNQFPVQPDPTKHKMLLEWSCEARDTANYCGAELREWRHLAGKLLQGKNDVILESVTSLERCQKECTDYLTPFVCRSVEYNSATNRCTLSVESTQQGGAIVDVPQLDAQVHALYEWRCLPDTCAHPDTIRWYERSGYYIRGHDDRVISGSVETSGACVALCEREAEFVCRSAEFSSVDLTCRLSRWTPYELPGELVADSRQFGYSLFIWECRQYEPSQCPDEMLIWTKTPGMKSQTTPLSVQALNTLEECERQCLEHADCASLAFKDKEVAMCEMYTSIGDLQNALDTAFYAWRCMPRMMDFCDLDEELQWMVNPGKSLDFYNDTVVPDVDSVVACQNLCMVSNFYCRSVTYSYAQQQCRLSRTAAPTQTLVDSEIGASYYTYSCTTDPTVACEDGYFIQWIEREGHVLSGAFDSVIKAEVTALEDCAKLCVTFTSFRCISFDYSAVRDQCRLHPVRESTGYELTPNVEYDHNRWTCAKSPQGPAGAAAGLVTSGALLTALTVLSGFMIY